jgi:hypothetical protein
MYRKLWTSGAGKCESMEWSMKLWSTPVSCSSSCLRWEKEIEVVFDHAGLPLISVQGVSPAAQQTPTHCVLFQIEVTAQIPCLCCHLLCAGSCVGALLQGAFCWPLSSVAVSCLIVTHKHPHTYCIFSNHPLCYAVQRNVHVKGNTQVCKV